MIKIYYSHTPFWRAEVLRVSLFIKDIPFEDIRVSREEFVHLIKTGILPNGKFQYGITKVEIDEKLLKLIANKTGGLYFRATDNSSLESIYNEINKLEKTEINEFKYYNYNEKYRIFVLIALIVIFVEWLLKNTLYKSFI